MKIHTTGQDQERGFFRRVDWLLLLLVLVGRMASEFEKTSVTAARLQIPYLLWLLFAGYLNLGVWLLNR